jgi:hypothetical protein
VPSCLANQRKAPPRRAPSIAPICRDNPELSRVCELRRIGYNLLI